jgi:hypothetical protein
MKPEVKVAADRLRRAFGGKELMEVIYDVPKRLAFKKRDDDLTHIAIAFLAEHPTDDDEPITAEWLHTTNGEKFDSGEFVWFLKAHGPDFNECWISARPGGFCIVTLVPMEGNSMWFSLEHQTRGHIRRIVAALGGSLKEPT